MSILTENRHAWSIGGADSKSRLRFLKFRPQNSFLDKFGPEDSKLSILSENWYTWYLKLLILIPNPDLDVWNSDPKIHFWANLGPKIQSCPFCLIIGTHNISRMLIPNPGLDFWNFDPQKSTFGQIWAQKFKVVRFVWKLVLIVSQGCWFRIQT